MKEFRDTMCLERIVKMGQYELKEAIENELTERGYLPISQKGFLYAQGDVPVLLVAHMDTVHKQPVTTICYSEDGGIMMSPEGIGGDDRCGVHMIMEIIKKTRCHVLFTEDEEIGCIGARDFARSKIRPQVNYIVEIDRRGRNDAVFYQCDNREFTEFVCCFGFEEARGSFSDISIIAPELGVAAVNISAGYYYEHSRHEYIVLAAVERNIDLISEMVQTPTERYDYMERRHSFGQLSFEDAQLWDFGGFRESSRRHKLLMPASDEALLIMSGYETTCATDYLIDNRGEVYRYLPEIDAAVQSEGAEVYNQDGTPLTFNRKLAKQMVVLTLESALELLA